MKKILALVLAISLIFLLTACGNKDTSSTNSDLPVSSVTDTTAFVKPQNYASVLLVTINPQFRLYLDEDSNVLAVEAVNQDAEAIKDSIIYENQNFEAVIKNIVATADDKGFLKEDANINFEIVEQADETINIADILANATAAANLAATELKITIKVNTIDITTPDVSDSSTETQTTSSTDNNSSTTPSTPTESKPVHTHTFSNATCTEAKKCSCGAIEGNALGHDYKNGVCSRCSEKDPNAVEYTSVLQKAGFWSCRYIINGEVGEQLYDATLIFKVPAGEEYADYEDSMLFVGGSRLAEPEDITMYPEEVFEYNGKKYVGAFGNGGNALGSVAENGTTIILTDPDGDGDKLELLRTGENTLKVVSSPDNYGDLDKIPVGTILTFSTDL